MVSLNVQTVRRYGSITPYIDQENKRNNLGINFLHFTHDYMLHKGGNLGHSHLINGHDYIKNCWKIHCFKSFFFFSKYVFESRIYPHEDKHRVLHPGQVTVQPVKSYCRVRLCANVKRIKLHAQSSQNPHYCHNWSMLISRSYMKLLRVTESFHATSESPRPSTLVSWFYSSRLTELCELNYLSLERDSCHVV